MNNFNQMQMKLPEESPRIAKITSSAQQFRELINSLRNHQIAQRHQSPKNPQNVETATHVITEQPKCPPAKGKEQLPPTSTIFEVNEEEEQGLKLVPKNEVGGRDQLRKIKAQFDAKPSQISLAVETSELKKEVSVQIGQNESRDINFSFESPRKNASTQCEIQQFSYQIPNESSFALHSSRVNQKAGQIVKQNVKNDFPVEPEAKNLKKIRDIAQKIVIEYCKKQKITEKSDPSDIFSFFTHLCMGCDIFIKSPSIKKFKNCIYYGFPIAKDDIYEGFLYFYDSRIYYGELLNGLKHGLGVQLNIQEEIKYKGEFNDGRKTGKFYVEKPGEKFIGYLQNGLYQGEGRLTTPDYVYEGVFEQGEKNGYGQEFYPKTGVKISGIFKNGILAKAKASKSISDMKHKSKVSLHKDQDKQRLELVRKKSLQKHNSRMNKVRSFRQSEYEIEFDTQVEYNELPKIHFNANKLEVYRQPLQKLPKITQDLDYSFEASRNFESLSSRGAPNSDAKKLQVKQKFVRGGGANPERLISNEWQQPLPSPCLSFTRKDR